MATDINFNTKTIEVHLLGSQADWKKVLSNFKMISLSQIKDDKAETLN